MSIMDNKGFFSVFAYQRPATWFSSHLKIKAFVKAHEKAACFDPFFIMPQNYSALRIISTRREILKKQTMFERVVRMPESCKFNCRTLPLAFVTAKKIIIKHFQEIFQVINWPDISERSLIEVLICSGILLKENELPYAMYTLNSLNMNWKKTYICEKQLTFYNINF